MANAENARFSAVIGDRELETGEIEIKEMATRTTHKILLNNLETFLKGHL